MLIQRPGSVHVRELPGSADAREGGYVLVVALLALALISSFMMAVTFSARSRVQTTANLAAQEEARLLADGFAETLAYDWSATTEHPLSNALGLKPGGEPVVCSIEAHTVEFRLYGASGLIDLNYAPAALLEQLFAAVAVPADKARALAAAVADYRDGDDEPTLGGAEFDQYAAAGLPFGPKNSLFESVAELDQVYGMAREVMRAVRPYVTVHSRASTIDPELAPPDLIAGLKLNNDSGASSLFFARAPEASKAIRIFVAVGTASGMRFERDALAERTTNAERRFVFREWTFVREQRQSVAPQRSLARPCF
jgi:general secretion pathway protein K